MGFYCDKCGLCCRHVDKVPQLVHFALKNGVCKYFHNNLCSIYKNRPEICRVDFMYEKYFKDKMTIEEYYKLNEKGCNELKLNNLQ